MKDIVSHHKFANLNPLTITKLIKLNRGLIV